MRHLLIALGLALAMGALAAGVALADGGPHGNYNQMFDGTSSVTTDKCAACHRVHQAQSAGFLLKKATQYELCYSCHNGTVSKLDVADGIRLTNTWSVTRTVAPTATVALYGVGILNGGGFEYVDGVTVTSRHTVKVSDADPGRSNPWGYKGDTGTASTALASALTCTSCHNPHGSANYRIIREIVNNRYVSVLAYTSVFTKDEGGPGIVSTPSDKYTVDYYGSKGLVDSGGYSDDYTLSNGTSFTSTTGTVITLTAAGSSTYNGFATLCGSCHTSYPSAKASNRPGDGVNLQSTGGFSISKYRHRTEMPYTYWNSPKYSDGPVPCNPETQSYNFSGGCISTTGGITTAPNLRLAADGATTDSGGSGQVYVTCLTCHRAHGSAVSMTGWSVKNTITDTNGSTMGSSPDDISPAQGVADDLTAYGSRGVAGGVSKSMLLYTNNRGMCEACHQW